MSQGQRLEEARAVLRGVESVTDRRVFLKRMGAAAAVAAVVGCEQSGPVPTGPIGGAVVLDFSSDLGVLNYAYALEQLEAAFYTQVTASFYSGATQDERAVLTDLRDHEIAHREFLKAALGSNAVGSLQVDFGAVNFSSRQSVLQTAQTFEDLGVAAYNGAARYLSDAAFLATAGKIVSVEARHASVIRELNGVSFAPDAFDAVMAPGAVLAAAAPFVETEITLRNA